MSWYKVANPVITNTPFIKKVEAAGRDICLVGYEGKVYALSARCPHAGEDLSGGWCKEGRLICPVHRFSYQLDNGRGAQGQGDYVRTYPVKITADGVYINVSTFAEKLRKLFGRKE